MHVETMCKELMDEIASGIEHARAVKIKNGGRYPLLNRADRGMSRTALKRKIVTLRQMLMDLHDFL